MKLLRLLFLITFFIFTSQDAWAGKYKRIISLSPSTTEIVYALGLSDDLVGVTDFCDWPPEAKDKASVGGIINPSLEAIVSLKPDIVLLSLDGQSPELLKRLGDMNVRIYTFKAKRLKGFGGEIVKLAEELGVKEEGAKLRDRINGELEGFENFKKYEGKNVIYIVWPEPLLVAGSGTSINDALKLLGLDNLASDAIGEYPRFSVEELIRRNPDVIFIGNHSMTLAPGEKLLKKLHTLDAVKSGNVFFIGDALHRLGPRTTSGVQELIDSLEGKNNK